jgi:Ca2+-transporting ATPase
LWIALVAVLILQVMVTHVGFMQSLFDTMSISFGQWMISIAIASSVLWLEEVRKFLLRKTEKVSITKEKSPS